MKELNEGQKEAIRILWDKHGWTLENIKMALRISIRRIEEYLSMVKRMKIIE